MKTTVTGLMIRRADERGHADHGGLKSQRTFSFAATRPTEAILFDLHSAMALAEELGRRFDNRPILVRHLGPVAKTCRWGRRNPRLAGLAAALALAVVGGCGARS